MESLEISNPEVFRLLPEKESYEYRIVELQSFAMKLNPSGFSVTLRLNIRTKESVLLWLNEFQEKNHLTLRVLQTYKENTPKIVFKRTYRCVHNTRPKKGSTAHPKHLGCTAKVSVTIKNPEVKRSKDIHLKTHPCEVYIRHTHNHPLYNSTVLKYRSPSEEVANIFRGLFEKGHSPSSALHTFKDNLLEQYADNYHEVIADGQKCPTQKWVYDLYYNIFKKEYGEPTGAEMIASLGKYIEDYNKKCGDTCAAIYQEGEMLGVAICTPIMKRVHENIKSAREIMFVDSSGNMDRHNTRVFLFLCPSCAGALPLGVLFLYSESEASITNGINLLKTILPNNSFYGAGFPQLIITDDSEAERNALQKCFKFAKLLLCKFHVLQAVMRYMWDSKNGLNKYDRVSVYKLFHEALNCLSVEDFLIKYDCLLKLECVATNKKVNSYLEKLKSSATIWALCYRQNIITRGNETNNYCEAMFRVFKDRILQRTKAFSIVQLFDYVTSSFESFFFKKIMDIINGRWEGSKKKNKYFIDDQSISGLECEEIGHNLYKVQSKDNEYIVNYEMECCSCYVGKSGAPCKHQFAVTQKFNLNSQQFDPTLINSTLKILLHKVVTGEECKLVGWYGDIDHTVNNSFTESQKPIEESLENNENQERKCDDDDTVTLAHFRTQLNDIFVDMLHKATNNLEEYKKPLDAFIKNYYSCKTDSSLISALHTFGKYNGAGLPVIKKGKNTQGGKRIGVQPTAVSRRKSKLAGRNLLQSGRPPKRARLSDHCYSKGGNSSKTSGVTEVNKKCAAPHSLQYCVESNISLGKTHSKK